MLTYEQSYKEIMDSLSSKEEQEKFDIYTDYNISHLHVDEVFVSLEGIHDEFDELMSLGWNDEVSIKHYIIMMTDTSNYLQDKRKEFADELVLTMNKEG